MSEIWKHDRLYSLGRPYVDWCTRQSFRALRYRGADPPTEGAVILAPNHTNTLMDALVMLAARPDATVFGARADIFRKPTVARILHFLRILPMVRQRDGLEHVSENYASFQQIDDVLAHNVPFCLFAEGTHRPARTLQPIKKGIARIALHSTRSRQTWLVPTGINYSDFYHFRGVCEVRYGQAVDISAFVREHAGLTEAQLLQELRCHIEERMARMVEPEGPATEKPHPLLLLVWPLAALLTLPIWLTAEVLCHKVKDKAWCNSIRCVCLVLLLPLTLLLWGLIFGLTLPWTWTLPLLTSTLFSYPVFYDGLRLFSKLSKQA